MVLYAIIIPYLVALYHLTLSVSDGLQVVSQAKITDGRPGQAESSRDLAVAFSFLRPSSEQSGSSAHSSYWPVSISGILPSSVLLRPDFL